MKEFLLKIWHEEDVDFGNAEFDRSELTFEDVVNGKTEYSYKLFETTGKSLKDIIRFLHSEEASFDYDAFKGIGWYAVTEGELGGVTNKEKLKEKN